MSYKKNISDVRNSPSLDIYKKLKDLKYNLDFNDDYVKEIKFKNKIFQSVELKNYNKYKIILLLTNHDYYKKLKFLKIKLLLIPGIIFQIIIIFSIFNFNEKNNCNHSLKNFR